MMSNIQELSNTRRSSLLEKMPIQSQQKVFRSLVLKNLGAVNLDHFLSQYFLAVNIGNPKQIVRRALYLGMELQEHIEHEYHFLFVPVPDSDKDISYIDWTTINYHTDWLSTLDISDFLFPLDNEEEDELIELNND